MMAPVRKSVAAMHGYVPGEQPDDPSIIKLNTNENPYPPSPAVLHAVTDLGGHVFRRYPDPLCSRLRRGLAELNGCSPEQILVGNGSDEVLLLALRGLVERSGSVGYFDPSYSLYPVLAQIEDIEARPVELGGDFSWAMPEGFSCDLFYLTNPNAPTGMSFKRENIETFCDAFSGIVLIDEAYADFAEWHCMDFACSRSNVLVSRSFSKSYSLAGIRLGYLVGPVDLIQALYKIKDSYNVNAITQAAGEAALSDAGYMKAQVARILATREAVGEALREQGFYVCPSQTNFLWVKPGKGSAEAWFEALRNEKILVRHFSGDSVNAFLRITVGTEEEMKALMGAVQKIGQLI